MALYTKQKLMDAYFAKVETNPSAVNDIAWFVAEITRVQTEIDTRLAQLSNKKATLIANATEKVNQIQTRIDEIEPDAKEKMKSIALAYIASQVAAQNEIDNNRVNL